MMSGISSTDSEVLSVELQRLDSVLQWRSRFPPALETGFQRWLHMRAMAFLRQYIRVLAAFYVLVVLLTLPKFHWLTPTPWLASDRQVYWWVVALLGGLTLVFALLVQRPDWDRWFRLYSPTVDILMLATVSLGMMALHDPDNVRIAMALLVVCFTIVFCTGMQPLWLCTLIAVLAFLLNLLGAAWLGLMERFWGFAFQFAVIFAGMALICHFMMRSQRQTFLQQELLRHDRERLQALSSQLSELSARDALTGIANRRRFDEVLAREWERSRRQGSPLALLFCDVDHFKAYNDHYGHQAGDECLQAIALLLQNAGRRPGDLVARYGGEEFVVLLTDTDLAGALETARRLRASVHDVALPHAATAAGQVSLSMGVAATVPGADAASLLIAAADRALYAAKAAGRDAIRFELP